MFGCSYQTYMKTVFGSDYFQSQEMYLLTVGNTEATNLFSNATRYKTVIVAVVSKHVNIIEIIVVLCLIKCVAKGIL